MSKVKDIGLSSEGRKLLNWAESNMPVLSSIRERFQTEKPLSDDNPISFTLLMPNPSFPNQIYYRTKD